MKKANRTIWICNKCGHISPKWSGQCTECGTWNSFQEKTPEPEIARKFQIAGTIKKTSKIDFNFTSKKSRISSGFVEFDRVLGGGFLSDSISLLIGNPGIGKSTITLQIAHKIAENNKKVLIASGEESVDQIADRLQRICGNKTTNATENVEILNEYIVENLLATANELRPDFLIIDSLQTFVSGDLPNQAGSIAQIRGITEKIMHFAKTKNIPCLLIGHVTKGGDMAGPQVLAHLVDIVLLIEGDPVREFRILRSTKNRFGSVFEVGIFEMTEQGLEEVKNPSEAFLFGRLQNAIGSVVFPTIEGTRPFLVEIQALTASTKFGLAKRTANGISISRLSLLLAVLQNYAKVNFETRDVFANVVGGFKINEPAADLSLSLALISAIKKVPISEKLFACGELGLSGEIRAVSHLEKRVEEAKKLGFEIAIVPKMKNALKEKNVRIIEAQTIWEAIKKVFGV